MKKMNKMRILLIIPLTLLPYIVLFTLATIFFSTEFPFFEYIMNYVFHGNGIVLIIALLVYCILTVTLSLVWFITSIRREWDSLSLAKCAMIVKLIQIPAYILIFIIGIFLSITIFTYAFSIGLFLLNYLTLLLTGLLTTSAAINAVRQGVLTRKEIIWTLVLQLVFCADVISSIVFYLKLKENHNIKNAKK